MSKTIDTEVLAALHLLSEGIKEGVNRMEFIRVCAINGVNDLIKKGYAEIIKIDEDNENYRFTDKGIDYLAKIINYASENY